MRGNGWWALLGAGALSAACGGSVEQAGPSSGAGAGNASAGQGSSEAAGASPAPASNGAITPELRATGLPLSSVLGQLDAASQGAVCNALGDWRFRLREPICNAFVESAVVLMPRTLEEDRQLCADNRDICPDATPNASGCSPYPTSCRATLAELDRCYTDMEQWFAGVPTCENMTVDRAYPIGPSPDSCRGSLDASCQPTR